MESRTILSRLDTVCHPSSPFWRRGNESCEWAVLSNDSEWVCHDGVDLTLCFQDTAILCTILFLFCFFGSLRLVCGHGNNRPGVPFNLINVAKIALCAAIAVPALADLFYTIVKSREEEVAHYQFLTPIALGLTMLMASLVIYFERKIGIRSSSLMTLLWLALVIYGGIKLRTLILISLDMHHITDKFRFSTFCLELSVFITQFLLVLIPEPRSPYDVLRIDDRELCPEESAPFFSRITWWWQNSLFWHGFKQPLTYDDLCDLNHTDKSNIVATSFELKWRKMLMRAGVNFGRREQTGLEGVGVTQRPRRTRPSIIVALATSFGTTFFVAGLFKLGQDLLGFVSPQILRLMVQYVHNEDEPEWKGYFYTALMFIAAVVQSIILHQYFHRCFITGMRVRTAVIAAVYRKALLLSNKARRTSTAGEIVNLMSVDAQRLLDLMTYLHMIWSAPLQIILSLAFLYQTMGVSIFAGFGAMLLMIPINAAIFAFSTKYQAKKMSKKDARIKLINEVLDGIKVIKLYAWEVPFKRLVSGVRNEELKWLRATAYLEAGASFTWSCAPFLVSIVTFATYSLVNRNNPENRLTADKAFVALSLFNILRFPLYFLPMLTSSIVQASVSIKRLGRFLQSDELDPDSITRREDPAMDLGEESVLVREGSFTWDEYERPALHGINLNIKPGELIAVVGQVGAGKSSLISALLGEMEKMNGHVEMKGRVAYVPQQAWIQNATVKDNILFGKPLSGMLYDQTLHACALEQDLEILPGGDMTEIGEKGINLSGGQKQRVSLARAVYQEADIYLLDDPLSAVDSHVGKHIFEKVIGPEGMLNNKVRLLVTHSIRFLPHCDKIIVMDKGRISEVGTHAELVNREGSAFAEFLQAYSNNQAAEGEESGMNKSSVSPTATTLPIKLHAETDEEKKANRSSALTTEETVLSGSVKSSVILAYIKACTYLLSFLAVLFTGLSLSASVGQNFWLARWSNLEMTRNESNLASDLGVYALCGLAQISFLLISTFSLITGVVIGSRNLHENMLSNIIRAPMSFFDQTPLGRVLNRFSQDIDKIDEKIPMSIQDFLQTFSEVIGTVIVVSIASPWFIVVIIPLVIFYYLIQRFYVSTSRQLNRLQSASQSPIFSHFRETITGTSSIRAYGQSERFRDTSQQLVDYNNVAYYPIICSKRWLAIRLEFIGNLIILFAALFAALQRNYPGVLGRINPGLAGLSISYALQVTQSLTWVVRMSSELESDIVAVERTKEYSETPTEADDIVPNNRPPPNWPNEGRIQFDRYSTRYREDLQLVLKDIVANIPGKQKVGIVGRTGAGKSSLTLALFRIIESVGGAILIDGIDIATIGLRDLRSRITIIPQDPVLFSGTLRVNLDPFDSHTDDEVWIALKTAHLNDFVGSLPRGLQHEISEGGENISVGQRQLVCLARALLRKTKILVLDEATAAVDMETDDLIQKTIRKEFADATVITIAHRLNTIMDYDRIIVLDNGHIVEFDSPNKLLENRGVFYGMAKDAHLI